MITEDFVSFDIAKLLKEKDFKEKCNATYNLETGEFKTEKTYQVWTTRLGKYISAPTLQMAMKWLRENYEIFIQPNIVFLYPIQYFATIFCYGDNLKTQQDVETERFDTYEQACEAAIKYCLENLI